MDTVTFTAHQRRNVFRPPLFWAGVWVWAGDAAVQYNPNIVIRRFTIDKITCVPG